MRRRLGNSVAYAILLTAQTAAVVHLFWVVYPVFHGVLTHLGEYQELGMSSHVAILGGVIVLHCSYWTRLKWVSVTPPFHSVFVSHLCSFAGRVCFLFSGAFFPLSSSGTFPSLTLSRLLGRRSSRRCTWLGSCSVFSATLSSLNGSEKPSGSRLKKLGTKVTGVIGWGGKTGVGKSSVGASTGHY